MLRYMCIAQLITTACWVWERLIQLHICSPTLPLNAIAHDSHDAPDHKIETEVISLVSQYPQLEYLTIEFYREKSTLVECVNRLNGALRKNS